MDSVNGVREGGRTQISIRENPDTDMFPCLSPGCRDGGRGNTFGSMRPGQTVSSRFGGVT